MSITFNQLKKLITKKEIDTVLVCVSDMQGRLNGKRVTGKAFIDYVYKETHMCDYLYTVDMDMFTVPGYKSSSWETGYGDMTVIPDLKTIKIANWLNKTAIVLSDCLDHSGKKPLIHSTRQILKDVLAKADKMGFKSMVGSELEFFLFNQTYEEIHNNNYTKLKESSWYIEDYMIFQTTKEEDVMQELRNSLLDSGIYVECSKGEAAPGQEEINVVFSDALNMADNHILIKNATKEIALKAISKKTGARGLRSILENILLKTMFELPSLENVDEVIVDSGAAKGLSQPIIVHSKNAQNKNKSSKTSAA